MRKIGFHLSISQGFTQVPEYAVKLGCNTYQIFSRNPRGWQTTDINKKEAREFIKKNKQYSLGPIMIHMPYLPNLASPNLDLYKKSIQSLIDEYRRAEILQVDYIIIHIGKRLEYTMEQGIKKVSKAVNKVLKRCCSTPFILLENTAGQGSEIGFTFEQIKALIDQIDDKSHIGVCLDTAHLFQAGYDLRDKQSVKSTFSDFDRVVGLSYLKVIHFNDSMTKYNSYIDRHQHIGEGEIGDKGMSAIINHPSIKHLPFIMETPYKKEGDDVRNMRKTKSYIK